MKKEHSALESAWSSYMTLSMADKILFIEKMQQYGRDLTVECIGLKNRFLEEIENCKIDDTHVFNLEYVKQNILGL